MEEIGWQAIEKYCKTNYEAYQSKISMFKSLDAHLGADIFLFNQFDIAQHTKPIADRLAKWLRGLENAPLLFARFSDFMVDYITFSCDDTLYDILGEGVDEGEWLRNMCWMIFPKIVTGDLYDQQLYTFITYYDNFWKGEKDEILFEFLKRAEKNKQQLFRCVLSVYLSEGKMVFDSSTPPGTHIVYSAANHITINADIKDAPAFVIISTVYDRDARRVSKAIVQVFVLEEEVGLEPVESDTETEVSVEVDEQPPTSPPASKMVLPQEVKYDLATLQLIEPNVKMHSVRSRNKNENYIRALGAYDDLCTLATNNIAHMLLFVDDGVAGWIPQTDYALAREIETVYQWITSTKEKSRMEVFEEKREAAKALVNKHSEWLQNEIFVNPENAFVYSLYMQRKKRTPPDFTDPVVRVLYFMEILQHKYIFAPLLVKNVVVAFDPDVFVCESLPRGSPCTVVVPWMFEMATGKRLTRALVNPTMDSKAVSLQRTLEASSMALNRLVTVPSLDDPHESIRDVSLAELVRFWDKRIGNTSDRSTTISAHEFTQLSTLYPPLEQKQWREDAWRMMHCAMEIANDSPLAWIVLLLMQDATYTQDEITEAVQSTQHWLSLVVARFGHRQSGLAEVDKIVKLQTKHALLKNVWYTPWVDEAFPGWRDNVKYNQEPLPQTFMIHMVRVDMKTRGTFPHNIHVTPVKPILCGDHVITIEHFKVVCAALAIQLAALGRRTWRSINEDSLLGNTNYAIIDAMSKFSISQLTMYAIPVLTSGSGPEIFEMAILNTSDQLALLLAL